MAGSLILNFDDPAEREAFLDDLKRRRPDICALATSASTRPDLVVEGLSGEQEEWVRKNGGRVFGDVGFDLFSG